MKTQVARIFVCALFLSVGSFVSASCANHSKIRAQKPERVRAPGQKVSMAPRLESLDGRTIYIVDVGYPKTEKFIKELRNVLKEYHPEANWVMKKKSGSYFDDDPELWLEIKEKGQGMIMAVGH